jgi:cysteinyl-tRNA synthetase
MNLRVYNTLSKTKEPFAPLAPLKVGIYLCGPTVYKEAHIGHMVGPVIFDAVKRYLTYCGYHVTWVVNITDVDDKLIAEANRRHISMAQVAAENTADYLKNLAALGVDTIDHMPKATDHIDEIIRFIEELIAKGFAYAADGDVFFDVTRDREYGKLSNRTADSQQGEGGEAASRKRSPGDFALWKNAKPGEPSWDSPWGKGRPGWHIECSAMSRRLLGETFDIHGGGLDLVFPHHENEIAQSECCHGRPMVTYWMHNGLMKAAAAAGKVGGRGDREQPSATSEQDAAGKISRSKGAGGLADLIAKHGGEKLRFFLLRSHYRSTSVFGDEPVAEAGAGVDIFYRFFDRYERITGESYYELKHPKSRSEGETVSATGQKAGAADALLDSVLPKRQAFLEKMDDDFNTAGAIAELFEIVKALNRFADQKTLEEKSKADPNDIKSFQAATSVLRELTAVLGLFRRPPKTEAAADDGLVDKLVQLLIEVRAAARKNKDFATSDKVRNDLAAIGILLEDRKEGTTWSRK